MAPLVELKCDCLCDEIATISTSDKNVDVLKCVLSWCAYHTFLSLPFNHSLSVCLSVVVSVSFTLSDCLVNSQWRPSWQLLLAVK